MMPPLAGLKNHEPLQNFNLPVNDYDIYSCLRGSFCLIGGNLWTKIKKEKERFLLYSSLFFHSSCLPVFLFLQEEEEGREEKNTIKQ
jgi:hypothetical protein